MNKEINVSELFKNPEFIEKLTEVIIAQIDEREKSNSFPMSIKDLQTALTESFAAHQNA